MDSARNDDLRLRRERAEERGKRPLHELRERPWDPHERDPNEVGPTYAEEAETARPTRDTPSWDSTARDQRRPYDGAVLTGPLPLSNTPYNRPRVLLDEDLRRIDGPEWTRRPGPEDGYAPAHDQAHEPRQDVPARLVEQDPGGAGSPRRDD